MNDSWTFPRDLLKKIPPQHYLHVLDNNTNVVRLEVGPQTYRCKDQESAVYGPSKMIVIPPRHYALIKNPVVTVETKNGREIVFDEFGQAKLRHGDSEVRLEQEPFPLYPGEILVDKIVPLEIVEANTALRLEAIRDFEDRYARDENRPIKRKAGDEWYFEGPATYIPQPEVKIVRTTKAVVIPPRHALRLTTQTNFTDRTGQHRVAGSTWQYTKEGFYLPSVEEQIVKLDEPVILTDKVALHLSASHHFVDAYNIERQVGSSWLVTNVLTEAHVLDVCEQHKGIVQITTLGKRQFMVIQNPLDVMTGRLQYGQKKIIKGEKSFFLHPCEVVVQQPREVSVITADCALLVQALKPFDDDSTGRIIRRQAGEKWLIEGPKEYWPPLSVIVIKTVRGLPIGSFVTIFRFDVVTFYAILAIVVLYLLWVLFF